MLENGSRALWTLSSNSWELEFLPAGVGGDAEDVAGHRDLGVEAVEVALAAEGRLPGAGGGLSGGGAGGRRGGRRRLLATGRGPGGRAQGGELVRLVGRSGGLLALRRLAGLRGGLGGRLGPLPRLELGDPRLERGDPLLVGALQRVDLGAQGGDGILGRGGGSGVGGRSGAPLCGRGGVAAAEGEAERQRGGEEGTARRARGPVGAKAGCRGRRAPVGEALTAFARDVVARGRSVHRVGSPFRIVAIGALVPARLAPCRTTLRGRS